jgi:exodeoxyribonuclease VII small subunit
MGDCQRGFSIIFNIWRMDRFSNMISPFILQSSLLLDPIMTKKIALPSLEASLSELTGLIEKMERSELNLEESLSQFERGVTLIKHARKILQTAEQKVRLLVKNEAQETLVSYHERTSE